ncbi:MAG: hypothetical protein ABSH09_23655 [Bryobacteraceae bacterium]
MTAGVGGFEETASTVRDVDEVWIAGDAGDVGSASAHDGGADAALFEALESFGVDGGCEKIGNGRTIASRSPMLGSHRRSCVHPSRYVLQVVI